MENATLTISITQALLVIAALSSCIGCIWMVFFFGRRIQTSAFLRDSLVSATKGEEFRNLIRELDDRRLKGPLDPSKQPPAGFEREATRMWSDALARRWVVVPAGVQHGHRYHLYFAFPGDTRLHFWTRLNYDFSLRCRIRLR